MKKNILMAFALFLCLGVLSPFSVYTMPRDINALQNILNGLQKTSVTYGDILSLSNPSFGRVLDADLTMDALDPVFIVELPDGPHVYPQRIMVWHMLVNEFVGDISYLIAYCPITGSLAAFQSKLDGTHLTFDIDGRLYDGNSVLVDRNTGSLWLQGLGMAFDGPLTGRGLPRIPVYWTTWEAAKRVYPNAQVLLPPRGGRKPYGRDPYGNYLKPNSYYDNDVLPTAMHYMDTRLPYKNPVLGLEYGNFILAVDINYVKKNGSVNFFLGDTPLLAVHDKKLDVVRIFNRQIWEKPSLFVYENGIFIDIATKTHWDVITGKATAGNMVGASMQQYFGSYSMWFNWYNLYPESYIIPGSGEVSKELLHTQPLDAPQ